LLVVRCCQHRQCNQACEQDRQNGVMHRASP
jgi:hypothetical protein